MMSPLTVSHFLAPEHTFDLIVFDEASQVPPQDAVNCIYRGRQLVVAGDSKQLPPTPFFQVAELDELSSDEEESRSEEDMESVLDSCGALLPSHSLRWHYRSRSEPLIAFSNQHIYSDSLVTFPSPDGGSAQRGVTFTYVPDGQSA
jgi:superfamily I DNA and/or RNA helicase